VVEKQIEPEILSADFERNLAPDKSEAGAELDEKLTQMFQESSFQIALLRCRGEGQEIEVVRVLNELLGKVRLWSGKRRLEIRDRLSLPPVKAALDLHDENVPAPSVLNRLADVPETFRWVLHFVQKNAIVKPGQLCSSLLHNCYFRPRLSKSPHVFEVAEREAIYVGEFRAEVFCQPLNYLRSPALFFLAGQNLIPNAPVEENKLLFHGDGGANLGGPNLVLQTGQKLPVALRI
jgi:hypothetical protein